MNTTESRSNLPENVIALLTWIAFGLTLALDGRLADLVTLRGFDVLGAVWLVSCLVGLAGAVLGLLKWPRWWMVCAGAAILLIVSHGIYWYDVFLAGDKTVSLAVHDFWKTFYHGVRSGALATTYRDLAMPIIQIVLAAYIIWKYSIRPSSR